jgi:alanyl-tRNA synthetase
MKPISSIEIRDRFLNFFEQRGHYLVPGSSLVPENDPTLLFTGAGMVQFKAYFSGEVEPPSRRLASVQKCFRTTDIDKVGNEHSLTFFEMLGNFSVGDYFKREAIELAWEFVTLVLELDEDRIWASIYHEDDEAGELWQDVALPASRVVRLGKEDNFWGPAGESGPCGPCSEIFYDRGPEFGCGRASCAPGCDCERFLEIWNLVFMEYDQDLHGDLTPLPQKNIDTGMGLERTAVVMQEVDSIYETDLFAPIVREASELAQTPYGRDDDVDRSLRIMAEHSRAISFLVADGVLPSNEGRGYVLRRILRRAVRHGRLLGIEEPFLEQIAGVVIGVMGEQHPELKDRAGLILGVIGQEERGFQHTLTVGSALLDDLIVDVSSAGKDRIPGDQVFRLYDTYGFPVELTREVAAERGLALDEEAFEEAMAEQREKARAAQSFGLAKEGEFYHRLELPRTRFVGYETLETSTEVLSLAKGGQAAEEAVEGEQVEVVLRETPFYAEAGGQVGDTGILANSRAEITVRDTQAPLPGVFVHLSTVARGRIGTGDQVTASVDRERRLDIARNHTATHLLHKALREVLGEHAQQSGSEVAPDRLRFDFTHLQAVTRDELERIETRVNAKLRDNLQVVTRITDYETAIASGAFALFGEKYSDHVRMVGAGDYTLELCGGTHVQATGEIGSFRILSEGSIGRGLRRIEAVTGRGADEYVRDSVARLGGVAALLGVPATEAQGKVNTLVGEVEAQRREILRLQRQLAALEVGRLLTQVQDVNGIKLVAAEVEAFSMETLREMSDSLRNQLGSAIIVLGAVMNGRPSFVVVVTPDLVARGLRADELVKRVAAAVGGGGGGRATLAQAGGKDPERLGEALTLVGALVAEHLGG